MVPGSRLGGLVSGIHTVFHRHIQKPARLSDYGLYHFNNRPDYFSCTGRNPCRYSLNFIVIYKKLKGGNFLFCVMAESPMSFTQKFIFRKSMTLSYLCSLTAFTDLAAFLFLLYLFSFQMQAFCSIIKFFLFLSRNFLFSH